MQMQHRALTLWKTFADSSLSSAHQLIDKARFPRWDITEGKQMPESLILFKILIAPSEAGL